MQEPIKSSGRRRYRPGISIAAGVLSVAMIAPFVSPVVSPLSLPVASAQTATPAAGGSQHSTGVWEGEHTVSGFVFIDRGSGSKHYNANLGDEYIDGIQVSGYWIDEDGAKSPVYHTFSGEGALEAGHFSLFFAPWTDANGVQHTFNAPLGGEQVSIWATLPDGSQYQIAFQDSYPVGDAHKRSRAVWYPAWNRVGNWHISLQDKPDPSWLSLATPTGPRNDLNFPSTNDGQVVGTVFWDPWTNSADFLYPTVQADRGDILAEGITVVGSYVQDEVARRFDQWKNNNPNHTVVQFQAAQKQIMAAYTAETGKPAIAETVTSVTNAQGEYKLQFQGLWGNSHTSPGIFRPNWEGQGAWGDLASSPQSGSWLLGNWSSKHINANYMYVYPVLPEGVSATMSSFQSAMFAHPHDGDIGQGLVSVSGLSRWYNLNFPLYALDPRFDVTPFDAVSNPAMPGDTVQTTATGLVPGQTYHIQWQRSTPTGLVNVGEPCIAVAGPDATVPSCPLTVPTDITDTTIYSATLFQPAGDNRNVYGVDSFAVTPNAATTPLGSLGEPYTGTFTQDVPAGASVTYSATGLPNGLSIDPATGAITGTPVVAADGTSPVGTAQVVITSNITYADGKTGTTQRAVPISITDTPLADATLGQPYTQAIEPQGLPEGAIASGITVTGLPSGLTFDPATNTVSGTPDTVGEFDNVVVSYTVTLADGTEVQHQDTVPLNITGDLAAAFTPAYENTAAQPGTVVASQAPTFDNAYTTDVVETGAAPEGTTFAAGTLPDGYAAGTSADSLTPGQVFVDPQTGVVSVNPLPGGEASDLTIPVLVTYADGTTDTAAALFNVGADNAASLDPTYQLIDAQQGGNPVTVPAPLDQNGQQLPTGTTFTAGEGFPEWATLNEDGSITVAPGADVPVGPVELLVTVDYPDGSSEQIAATVNVVDQVAPVIDPIADVTVTEDKAIE
ncbi:Rib/alpha-like domain-containing protein, partial [Corynebacterium nasicanis]